MFLYDVSFVFSAASFAKEYDIPSAVIIILFSFAKILANFFTSSLLASAFSRIIGRWIREFLYSLVASLPWTLSTSFRDIKDILENNGFNITMDEADLGDSYNIVINIVKNNDESEESVETIEDDEEE